MRVADVFPRSGAGALRPRLGRRGRVFRFAGVMLLVLQLLARPGLALDITTPEGRTYRDCTISEVEPDGLRIIHADGAARIPYEKLPTDLQKRYFDPVKVAAYREVAAEAQRVAAIKAEEARRQRAIAAAQAEEQRELKEESRQREESAQKAVAQMKVEQVHAAERREKTFGVSMLGVAGCLGIFLYFLPTIVGGRKTNAVAIFMLNLFLGWTFLGWVLALVWACTEDSALERLARERMNMPPPQPPPPPSPGHLEAQEAPRLESGGRYLE